MDAIRISSSGFATATATIVAEDVGDGNGAPASADSKSRSATRTLVLQLKKPERKVVWSEEVVNNEHMNKKSSKRAYKAIYP
jgi:hypothetical protein